MLAGMLVAQLAMATMVPVPAPSPTDFAARAILAERYDRAEAVLAARLADDPGEPSALLNAAYLYERTGRPGEAQRTYAQVLAGENVLMDLASGRTAWSHDLARGQLGRLEIASR